MQGRISRVILSFPGDRQSMKAIKEKTMETAGTHFGQSAKHMAANLLRVIVPERGHSGEVLFTHTREAFGTGQRSGGVKRGRRRRR
jgi:hypothetical protein